MVLDQIPSEMQARVIHKMFPNALNESFIFSGSNDGFVAQCVLRMSKNSLRTMPDQVLLCLFVSTAAGRGPPLWWPAGPLQAAEWPLCTHAMLCVRRHVEICSAAAGTALPHSRATCCMLRSARRLVA